MAGQISAAEMKHMRRTAGYTWTDYKTNLHILKELEITQVLDKLLEYKRNWIQHVNRMPRDRLPRIMKHYSPTGRRNRGRPLKRLLDMWDRNGSTSGLTAWQTYDDDDDSPTHSISRNAGYYFTWLREVRLSVCHFSNKSGFFDKHVKNSSQIFYRNLTNTFSSLILGQSHTNFARYDFEDGIWLFEIIVHFLTLPIF